MLTSELRRAIALSIKAGIPFVAFAAPGQREATFFADIPDVTAKPSRRFLVNGWSGGSADQFAISDRADAACVISKFGDLSVENYGDYKVWDFSTTRGEYEAGLDEVIDYLNYHGGKVVISRTITGDAREIDWPEVADRYFDLHDEAFRYLYYTPRHGCWLGASPELLLTVANGEFTTMALAGTRSIADNDDPWSGKNVAEQAIVRDYIVDRLYDLGLNPQCSPTTTLTTGNIQHLCTVITGKCESCSPDEILRSLNPTPALAGYPLASALEQIAINERHPRRCYGGYVALQSESDFEAYVNLRCVNFDKDRWCIYVGSGIMPDSDPGDEWRETEAKAMILKNIIEGLHK